MALKEHLHSKLFLISIACIILYSCVANRNNKYEAAVSAASYYVNNSLIPNDTILSTNEKLKVENGIYYFDNKLWSGYIKMLYPNGSIQTVGGILNGMLYGRSISYYPGGQLRDIRMYKENKSTGRQIGFWENGNQKFEFYYLCDKREGSNKQWYNGGQPYAFLNFKDDRENGIQQAWRENGKVYINYEAKDGFRYGLQKSALCYTLEKEKFK